MEGPLDDVCGWVWKDRAATEGREEMEENFESRVLLVLDRFLVVIEAVVLQLDLEYASFRLVPCAVRSGAGTTTVELSFEAKDFNNPVDFVFSVFCSLPPFKTDVNSVHTCWLNSEGLDSADLSLIKGSGFCFGMPNNLRRICFMLDLCFFPIVLGSGRAPLIVLSERKIGGGGDKKSVENLSSILRF